ncbi:MAG: type IV pilus biogenesis/stability protein PilW [Gammaproteobacteria bacterium]
MTPVSPHATEPVRAALSLAGLTRVLGGLLLASVLAACATGAGNPAGGPTAEPMTESDEPEARKRARLRVELAGGYFEQGQTTVALDEIKQAVAADPTFGPAYVLRGLVYMRLNDNRLAEDSFQRALQLNSRDPDALHNYGWFQCLQGRHQQAIDLFTRALANPTYGGQAKTLKLKGVCQIGMGQLPEAEGALARAYELDPADPVTAYNLANLIHKRGDDAKAQFYARRLNNSEFANAQSLWLGIRIERRLGERTAVEQLAQQLGRRYPQSPEWAAYQRGAFNE